MHILFIEHSLSLEGEPLGIMQLSALAKNHGHNTSLTFLTENYLNVIKQTSPDVIAISIMSCHYSAFKSAIHTIKRSFPSTPIIAGGPHPTFSPNCIYDIEVDAICIGEGDFSFIEFLNSIEHHDTFENISNIRTRTSSTSLRPLIANLDDLPFIDREITYDAYPAANAFSLRSFYTTRGCPFSCTYCFNHAYNKLYSGLGKIVRRRSVNNVIQEMKLVTHKYKTSFIKISDDSFVLSADNWLRDFSERYSSEISIPFYCLLRADIVTEEIVYLLKKAGCASLCMSIETSNDQLRKNTLKRNTTSDTILKAFDLVNSYGIKIYTNSMLGLPGATFADDLNTLDFTIKCKPAYGHFTILTPYLGTDIYEQCKKLDILDPASSLSDSAPSTNDLSVLTSFTDAEKNMQRNIHFLGPTIVMFPFLKPFFIRHLINLPSNFIYFLIYFATKSYSFNKHIIKLKHTPRNFLILFTAFFKALLRSTKL
ncbi:2-hydroxyethylphosphonate methyltransferase [Fundidesulfovibrio magnetotacticus]|uniref:2-hydroxyethylphosphonate methyltransferase n=1 Tax=Fundidesulfovibrio magnetotacticus TaxID=2730080 RepID=A0A6V8LV47_9BACT|nr:radical SAM protein [Fundidesulfovibrio magnetotacticus]GFK94830.1 2-hydroxyethylphosphonate methyltransferase [Fundidesulfovibrio magnetotacticus]